MNAQPMPGETRADILQLLQLPRKLLRGQLELEECKHQGDYDAADRGCVDCDYAFECEWLYRNDEFSTPMDISYGEIVTALGYSVLYVDAYVTRAKHGRRTCPCEICTWLKRARKLHDTIAVREPG